MPDPQYEYRKQRYESYVKERDSLNHSSLEISGRYDKSVLFLSGGALALSVISRVERVSGRVGVSPAGDRVSRSRT
jgi:hypothetical protein